MVKPYAPTVWMEKTEEQVTESLSNAVGILAVRIDSAVENNNPTKRIKCQSSFPENVKKETYRVQNVHIEQKHKVTEIFMGRPK